MRKKPGHCFMDPGFDPRSKVCAKCLEYVRVKCADRKARMEGSSPEPERTDEEKALTDAVELDERFLDMVAAGLVRTVRMGVETKQVVFRDGAGRVVVFAAYSRRTGRMKVNTEEWPKGRMFELKSAEEAEALAREVAALA